MQQIQTGGWGGCYLAHKVLPVLIHNVCVPKAPTNTHHLENHSFCICLLRLPQQNNKKDWVAYTAEIYFLLLQEARWKSKIKVPEGLPSGETSLLGLQTAPSSYGKRE